MNVISKEELDFFNWYVHYIRLDETKTSLSYIYLIFDMLQNEHKWIETNAAVQLMISLMLEYHLQNEGK